jgi:uncharacterized protein (DUF433 family)
MMNKGLNEDTSSNARCIRRVMDRYQQAEEVALAIAKVADHCKTVLNYTGKLGAMAQPATAGRLSGAAQGHDVDGRQTSSEHTQLQEQILSAANRLSAALDRQKTALETAGGMESLAQFHQAAYDSAQELDGVLAIDPELRSGKPCIRGMRISVYDVLDYLISGMTQDEILTDYPELMPRDIQASRTFATKLNSRLSQFAKR